MYNYLVRPNLSELFVNNRNFIWLGQSTFKQIRTIIPPQAGVAVPLQTLSFDEIRWVLSAYH